MTKIHLINSIYQVYNDDETEVLFQGTSDECDKFMLEKFMDKIINTPELLDVFKRLKDR